MYLESSLLECPSLYLCGGGGGGEMCGGSGEMCGG